jgi:peptide/nickel transport system substrate-binding protein
MQSSKCGLWDNLLLLTIISLNLASCGVPTDVDIPLPSVKTPEPAQTLIVPTPEPPPKTLVVCLNKEPTSLYLYSQEYQYGDTSKEANAVLEAIYDGPLDLINYEVQSVLLQRVPDLSTGEDARLEDITLMEGDVYLNPETLQPERLMRGKPYLPSGCRASDCIQIYEGGVVVMQRMVVDFHLKPGLTWSDGEPLTASDSVFSYMLDVHPDTPTTKYLVERTLSYVALDDVTVRWFSIPSFLDTEYATNFWTPLPEHILGEYTPAELLSADETTQQPLGWGPYVIQERKAGEYILMKANSNYHRASEDLPKFDLLMYRFLGSDVTSAIQQLLTGECDLLDESLFNEDALPILLEMQEEERLKLIWAPGAEMERLDFNLSPLGETTVGALFVDGRTRQAIAGCIDRQRIIDEVFFGMSVVPDTYVSPSHPDHDDNLVPIPYSVSLSIAILEEIGWQDDDGAAETPRVAMGVSGIRDGTPFSFTYLTTGGSHRELVAERLQSDLSLCGLEINIEFSDPDAVTAAWPEGLVFGRSFDMVGWSWSDWISPLCEMFAGREIPSSDNPFGSNASAFNNSDYNLACDTILYGPSGTQAYDEAVKKTQEIFSSEIPAIPLYLRPRFVAISNDLCGVEIDSLTFTSLWGLESYDSGDECDG